MTPARDAPTEPEAVTAPSPLATADGQRTAPVGQGLTDWLPVAIAMGITGAFAGFRLGRPSFWWDEAVSVVIADGDLAHLIAMASGTEASGSLFYLVLGAWLTLGEQEWVLRSLSLIFALLTLPMVYLLTREVLGHATASVATILLSANALFLTYARTLRGYSLAILLVTAFVYCTYRAVRDGSRRWWWLWAVIGAASVYAHLFGLLVIASQVVAFPLLLRGRRQWVRAGIATCGAGLMTLPMLGFVVTTSGDQIDWARPFGVRSLTRLALEFSGVSVDIFAANWAIDITGWHDGTTATAVIATLAVVPVLAFAVIGSWRASRVVLAGTTIDQRGPVTVLSWLVAPVLGAALVSVLVRPVFVPRYLLLVLPAFVIVVAAGITASFSRRGLLVTATVLTAAVGLPTIATLYDDAGRQDWRSAMGVITDGWRAGDAILARRHSDPLPAVDYYLALDAPQLAGQVLVYSNASPLDGYDGREGTVAFAQVETVDGITAERLWHVSYHWLPTGREMPREPPPATPGWAVERSWVFRNVVVELLVADDDLAGPP